MTRESRIESSWASKIGSSSDTAAGISFVTQARAVHAGGSTISSGLGQFGASADRPLLQVVALRSHCLFLLGVVGQVLGVLSLGASGAQTGEMLAQFVGG